VAIERESIPWRELPQLTVKEASAVLGVGVDSVRALLKQNRLDGRQLCGKTFIIVASLRSLMDEEAEPLKSIGQRRPLTPAESKTLRELQ
jgi:excisionase family DNA binding protein